MVILIFCGTFQGLISFFTHFQGDKYQSSVTLGKPYWSYLKTDKFILYVYADQDIHKQLVVKERHCYTWSTSLVSLFMLFPANEIIYVYILEQIDLLRKFEIANF